MTGGNPEWEAVLEELRASPRPRLVLVPDPAESPRSVALLAGSFDPITIGHAAMAEAVARRVELVVLVYSVRTLPKEGPGPAALLLEKERVAALDAFCRARSYAVGLSSHGLLADQVAAAGERFPGAEIVVVMGSDKLLQLFDPRWYGDVDAALTPMFERARVAYTVRTGDDEAVEACLGRNARWGGRIERLHIPPDAAAASSRRVRELLARGDDVSTLVPAEVRAFLPG